MVPLYFMVCKQIHINPLGLEIPFFERDTDIGYLVNLEVQGCFGMVAVYILLFAEVTLCLACCCVVSVPDLIDIELTDLRNAFHAKETTSSIKFRLRNITMKVEDYVR